MGGGGGGGEEKVKIATYRNKKKANPKMQREKKKKIKNMRCYKEKMNNVIFKNIESGKEKTKGTEKCLR